MGRKTQSQAGSLNGPQIGALQILLSQVDTIRAVADGRLPMVVDKQAGLIAAPQRYCLHDLLLQIRLIRVFDAQLQGAHTPAQQFFQPRHRINHRIEPQRRGARSKRRRWITGGNRGRLGKQLERHGLRTPRQNHAREVSKFARPPQMGNGARPLS